LRHLARSVTPRAAGVVFLLAAVVAIVAATATAAPGPSIPAHIGGVVPLIGHQVQGSGDLTYHGGPTMTTNKTYAIYWVPSGSSMPSGYQSTINQFFGDVAHDSNMSSNVYAATTQYSSIQYNSTFGASTVDTNPFPSNGCSVYAGVTRCLTDAQLQQEILNVISAQGWTKNGTNMFFLFTPQGVGSCFDTNPADGCAYTDYCAYHGTTNSGGAIYANQPYADVNGCTEGQYPNGNPADSTINVTSHEHNEAITDPQLNAWFDAAGYETGDKCAWDFGSVSGSNGSEYNQTINGNHYFLQREYSNATHACVQTYQIQGGGQAPTVTSFSPTSGPVGQAVDVQGTNFTGATAVKFNGTADPSFVVNSSTDISAHVPTGATSGTISVTTPNGTGTSSTSFTVTGGGGNPPTVTSFTPASGPVGTSVAITGTNFTGATSVTFNGTAASTFTVNSSTTIHATVPTGATTGKIAVTTGNGTGTSLTNFTVTTVAPKPTITGFTPTQGFPGTKVTITGTNFTGATSVKLGSRAASFTVNSSTSITATVPTESFNGSYRWSVTTPGGTATSVSFFRYL
jgi:IPT/TIG domain-containing protein